MKALNSMICRALYLQYLFKYFRHIRSYEHFFNNFDSSYFHLISSIIVIFYFIYTRISTLKNPLIST